MSPQSHELELREQWPAFVGGQMKQDFIVDSVSISVRCCWLRAKFGRFTGNHLDVTSTGMVIRFVKLLSSFSVPIGVARPSAEESPAVTQFCRHRSEQTYVRYRTYALSIWAGGKRNLLCVGKSERYVGRIRADQDLGSI